MELPSRVPTHVPLASHSIVLNIPSRDRRGIERAYIPKGQGSPYKASSHFWFEVPLHHFNTFYWAKASHSSHLRFKWWVGCGVILQLLMKEWHGHNCRRACGMEDTVVPIIQPQGMSQLCVISCWAVRHFGRK